MPLNIFGRQELSWTKTIRQIDFITPLVTAQKRISDFDDSAIFAFIRQHGLTYADHFVLSLSAQNELQLKKISEQFAPPQILLLLNQPNKNNLQNNGTAKQPVTKRQLRPLQELSAVDKHIFNLELNGIYQQLLHLNDLRFDQKEQPETLVFNYRVYPLIYRFVMEKYHVPDTSGTDERAHQFTAAVNDIFYAYLWLKIKQLTSKPLSPPVSSVIRAQHISRALSEIDYLQLTSEYSAKLDE